MIRSSFASTRDKAGLVEQAAGAPGALEQQARALAEVLSVLRRDAGQARIAA